MPAVQVATQALVMNIISNKLGENSQHLPYPALQQNEACLSHSIHLKQFGRGYRSV